MGKEERRKKKGEIVPSDSNLTRLDSDEVFVCFAAGWTLWFERSRSPAEGSAHGTHRTHGKTKLTNFQNKNQFTEK